MKRTLFSLIAIVAPLHAAPLDPAQLPSSAKWYLHADIEAMRASDTGKAVFSHIEAEHGAQILAAKRMFSLNPMTDLSGVTLFGDGKKDRAVALIHGNFNRAHLEEIVAGAEGYSKESHAGTTVHHWQDKGKEQNAAFASDTLLVFSGQPALLHEALDTLKAKPAEAAPATPQGAGNTLVQAHANLSQIELPGDEARLLRLAETLNLGASENAGRFSFHLAAKTADGTRADQLRRICDGVFAFVEACDPKLHGLDLQGSVAVIPEPSGISATVSLPVVEWLQVLQKAGEEAKKLKK